MTRRLVVRGLGSCVAIELLDGDQGAAVDDALLADLERAWSRARAADDAPVVATLRARLGLPEDGLVDGPHPASLATRLTQAVTHALIDEARGRLLMFHAGAVAHPTTGASLAFVARGGTGKTTLTTALGARYGYLTDETVGVRPDGRIEPYPKPLSIRGDGPGKRETSPDELGLLPAPGEPRIARVVLLDRDPLARQATATQLGTLDAIVALAPETSSLGRVPRALHTLAELLRGTGGVQRWTYADHAQLRPLVADVLGAP